ncbi:hypothetical protein TPHA_0H02770 [Tetrapisispora phaffii CBS 4417]|uniref:Uncharacterized protein n=1 Tax=Tetrapisispora phaffii (strain ATCC 24235 / CBS 4417 / NBRC 1672 / NRRL Y-8282 / UCD 70-5) TaxID=1071381 RepID=G8BWM9_TETPH|nr:hypothetical protein TPHA_0H02770 [Tetrapisispora phaffii CBS 4417]CCE64480.1 hypothetical protein TPHA_0H02770 [Tetrapisispora phaffii CBS 4417]
MTRRPPPSPLAFGPHSWREGPFLRYDVVSFQPFGIEPYQSAALCWPHTEKYVHAWHWRQGLQPQSRIVFSIQQARREARPSSGERRLPVGANAIRNKSGHKSGPNHLWPTPSPTPLPGFASSFIRRFPFPLVSFVFLFSFSAFFHSEMRDWRSALCGCTRTAHCANGQLHVEELNDLVVPPVRPHGAWQSTQLIRLHAHNPVMAALLDLPLPG